jgi:hypothetical protein
MKKINRSRFVGGPMEAGDDKDPDYKVIKCSVCSVKAIMMRKDYDSTIDKEKVPCYCLLCAMLLGELTF